MNEHTLKTVVAFNNLDETPEIQEIKRQFLADEISAYEFYSKASRILDKHKAGNAGDEYGDIYFEWTNPNQ